MRDPPEGLREVIGADMEGLRFTTLSGLPSSASALSFEGPSRIQGLYIFRAKRI